MSCICGSIRIMTIQAHCVDSFSLSYGIIDYQGYVPSNLNIGGGDDVELDICLQCGRIQYWKPVSEGHLQDVLKNKSNS